MDSINAWDKVKCARDNLRPTATDYISELFDGFLELHGDRSSGDDRAVICGVAMMYDLPVTVIAQQRGKDTHERKWRNFGMCHPDGYRKSLRLMKQAEKFGRPIICIVDTPGAFCGELAEQRGQAGAIAQNLFTLPQIKVPIISLVIGEGGSGGALAISVSDKFYMMKNSIYSVISPEGCASILFKDPKKADYAAQCLKLTAQDLLEMNLIDEIIDEPDEFSRENMQCVTGNLKKKIYVNLKLLMRLSEKKLLLRREQKYYTMGREPEVK